MNDKQRRLINYFNNLREPVAPATQPAGTSAGEVEELIVSPVAKPPEPVRPSSDSVRRMLEKWRPGAPVLEGATGSFGEIEEGLPAAPVQTPFSDRVIEVAVKATEKVLNDQEVTFEEQEVLEAIILPGKRPVLDISNGTFSTPPPDWEFLNDHATLIHSVLPSIGRIDVPEMVNIPYGGTGFFIGADLLVTNRHVARLFVQGVGAGPKYLTFLSDRSALFDSQYEVGDPDPNPGSDRYEVVEPLLVHPHWDAAILRVRPLGNAQLPPALKLSRQPPPNFGGGAMQHVIVVGYPMLDPRNDVSEQMEIFHKIFGRKRLMPGYMLGYRDVVTKWDARLHAATHDASTLGGNSGSAVIDLTTGIVLALHFGGTYLDTNYGCPTWELAQDQRVSDLNPNFVDYPGVVPAAGGSSTALWLSSWNNVKPLVGGEAPTTPAVGPPSGAGGSSLVETPVLPVAPDWFERTSDADLVEGMRRDPQTTEQLIRATLLPQEADDLIGDLRRGLATPTGTVEEGIFDFLTGGPKTDPSLPEIIFLHGIMGGHLAAFGSFGGRVWLSPLAFAAGKVARRLTLTDDGQSDLFSSNALYPDGLIRMVYEKAARKWRMSGFVVHEFAFDWRKPLTNSADRLDLFIKMLSLERPAKKFAVVAHSMGGLVAALYAARHPEWSTRITQAIFLGAPLRGSYAPIEALLGTYPLFPKFALVDRQDDLGEFIAMARTLPGLLDMLPDPEIFPDAAPLYERATWPATGAPAQIWLDQSRQVKRLLATSPILETARLIVSPAHPTVGNVTVTGGKLQPGGRNAPGDGTVPTRSAAGGLTGFKVHRATFSHGELPREPAVIEAVADLLKNGACQLPLLSPEEILSVAPIEEAITESIEEATAADFGLRIRSGIFTQRDVDFLLRADHSTLPGMAGPGA